MKIRVTIWAALSLAVSAALRAEASPQPGFDYFATHVGQELPDQKTR